jgi:hypothetical protein
MSVPATRFNPSDDGDSIPESAPSGERPQLRLVCAEGEAAVRSPVLQSPSLDRRQACSLPAHEMKFLLDEARARELEQLMQPHVAVDPHAEAGGGYSLTTLYCDTPVFDVYLRRGRYRLFKFRLRRYGDATTVYLERKSKRGLEVRKRRSTIALEELARFSRELSKQRWGGSWYHSQLLRNGLAPVCLLRYERLAFFGESEGGPFRLTFDRHVAGCLTNEWSLEPRGDMQPLLADHVVGELKYRGPLPALFKSVIEALRLVPVGVSKYRHCLQSSGIEPSGGMPHA